MIKFFLSRFIPVMTITMLIVILSSCTLTVEDQQGEKYKVDIQKIDEKKDTRPNVISKNESNIVEKKIEVIKLTDDYIRQEMPSIYQNYIAWKDYEIEDDINNLTQFVALYSTKTKAIKKLYLWDKKYTKRENANPGSQVGYPIMIYKDWLIFRDTIYDGNKGTTVVKVYLYDINKDVSYLIYGGTSGVISYFDNGIIVVDGKWVDFTKLISEIGKDTSGLFESILPNNDVPEIIYFDGKNLYLRQITRYDTLTKKITGKLNMPYYDAGAIYATPTDTDNVIYVYNTIKVANFKTDLVENYKTDFNLDGVYSNYPIIYDHDDNILIVPQTNKAYVLYLGSGKKYEITMRPGYNPAILDYDEVTNILTWMDISNQGNYLTHTDSSDIYMTDIPKN